MVYAKVSYCSISAKSKYRNFFLCAFSNILKPTSRWLQKSIKPTIDHEKKVVNVWDAFYKQFKVMKKANLENIIPKNVSVIIETRNFMKKRITNKKVNLLVTSPPYVTSYEYADLHQMSLLWLDFASDFRVFRKGSIGSSFHISDFKVLLSFLWVKAKQCSKMWCKYIFLWRYSNEGLSVNSKSVQF